MYLNELPNERVKAIVLNNDELQYDFAQYLMESAIDECRERLDQFSGIDYCLNGYRQPDYVRLNEYTSNTAWRFLYELDEYSKIYGISDRLKRKLWMVKHLDGSNLFLHHAKLLVEIFYEDEIKPEIDYAKDGACLTGSNWDEYVDSLENFLDGTYEYDEETDDLYVTTTRHLR